MKTLFCVLLFTLCFGATAQVRINNGGEGIWLSSSELFVLDLYENGTHFAPFFGRDVLPRFREGVRDLWPAIKVDRALLARKLTDLERAFPGLGDYTLLLFEKFQLQFKGDNERLFPFYPDKSELEFLRGRGMGMRFETLAIRLRELILIDAELWWRLNYEHQVALLIHEALFSLARLDCRWSDTDCVQFSPDVRSLVGRLFSAKDYDAPATYRQIQDLLQIPDARTFGTQRPRFRLVTTEFKVLTAPKAEPQWQTRYRIDVER